jgi:hypothetical protein
MALRAVPDHPKFANLKGILGQPKFSVLGLLEAIWHFSARFTPQGNIGKYTDGTIEAWVEWNGTPGALIAALVRAGWLDENRRHRLVIHDWAQHADTTVHTHLARKLLRFVDGTVPKTGRLNQHERAKSREWMASEGLALPTIGRPRKKSAKSQP